MQFSKEFIEQVRAGNPIVDVVGSYVPLTRKQNNYWACCPFHEEKTPSFSVSPDKEFFYCFGCHAGGDVFQFVQKIENISFPESVEKLAQRIGLEIPKTDLSPAEREREEERQRLYEICDLAASYFHNCLTKTRMGAAGIDYFKKRGLSAQTIVDFKLGFAPPQWDRLYRDFRERGYREKDLIKSGLCLTKNGKTYDRFRGRCMFPIRDDKGRVVAFGGRIIEEGEPKYLNSPESPIFHKGDLLFAMERARKEIRKTKQAVLVEGYMDVVGVHNLGVTNVVASLGTAFTQRQAQLLRRICDVAIVAYDMDRAGREATRRAIAIARETGLKLRIATLPDGKDPDEYIKQHGANAWEDVIAMAQNVLDYRLDEIIAAHDATSTDGKNMIVQEFVPEIMQTDNAITIDSYLRRLATRLRMNENIVRSEAQKIAKAQAKNVYIAPAGNRAETAEAPRVTPDPAEDDAIRLLFSGSAQRQDLLDQLTIEDFTDPLWKNIFVFLQTTANDTVSAAQIGREISLTADEQARLSGVIIDGLTPRTTDVALLIRRLRKATLVRSYNAHRKAAERYNQAGDVEAFRREMELVVEISQNIHSL
ncbi:MAG: DNA primase [Negativicoccus succinicivorans]|nr:DNA primase [Negativicoccus succinicivorans]MBS5917560.1 DNA primase [Negativicoccus succinicivorans]MDU1056399.1 DNA primase [Negativicoccus succinicivorans]MDU5395844.1 DNA primase [Negativicoccus succinicivorans]